jgi:hypothetical protein
MISPKKPTAKKNYRDMTSLEKKRASDFEGTLRSFDEV